MMTKNSRHSLRIAREDGFTLVEMAVGLVVVSILVSLAVLTLSGAVRFAAEQKTLARMERIADAISVYAQKHMRVPCPADPAGAGPEPFGTERGSVDGTNFGVCNTLADAEGIVPFATLGLSQKYATDHFKNFFTYRVSLSSAEAPAVSSTRQINNWCMTQPHWNIDGTTDGYVALAKAAFCCGTFEGSAAPANDVEIRGSFGRLADLSRLDNGRGGDASEYRSAGSPPPDDITQLQLAGNPTLPPVFPAYILVSHGGNGLGAFTATGTRVAGAVGPELENANGDNVYFAPDRLAYSDPGTGPGVTRLFREDIDDIVIWGTPAQILGRVGGVSCARP